MVWLLAAVALAAAQPLAAAQKGAAPAKFSIVHVALHQYDDGPPMGVNHYFIPGDSVFVSFQAAGYAASEKSEVRLSWRIEVFDPRGVPLVPVTAGKVEEALSIEDKNWLPKIRHNFLIPLYLDSGAYRIAAAVKDELNGASATIDIPFRVRGIDVAPSETLVVRNFRFVRSENSDQLVTAFRPGQMLWARFEVIGYKLGPKNRYEVEYGLAVKRGDEVLYAEPKAAEEQDENFYPKRYLPGALSLNLQKEVAPGEYTLVVTVRDRLGKQTAEESRPFRVE